MPLTKQFITKTLIALAVITPTVSFGQTDMAGFSMTRTCVDCDFSEATLPLANFSSGTFRNVNFIGAMLQNSDFTDSSLNRVHFDGADMRGANFSGASIDLSFSGGFIDETSFDGADLRGANFTQLRIVDNMLGWHAVHFTQADLRGANFNGSSVAGDFTGAQISSANFSNSIIPFWNNSDRMWGPSDMGGICSIEFGQMTHRNVNFANIRASDDPINAANRPVLLSMQGQFDGANFTGASVIFRGPRTILGFGPCELSFTNSNFREALIMGYLANVDFSGSSFVGARVNADFSNTNLENVDFTDAVLTGSNFQGARFCNTTAPDGTIMYDGC